MRRRNPSTRLGYAGVDGIRTCSKFDAGAGPRKDHPISRPKSSNEPDSDGCSARLSTASVGADWMRGRQRYRTANAESENEPREDLDALHHAQLTTAPSRQNFRQSESSKQSAS
jgi:hypothetical protein